MEPTSYNAFTFLIIFTGLLMLVQFIIYKFFPPHKKHWYNDIMVKKEWRNNKAVWREAQRFLIKPCFILGMVYVVAGILSIFFSAPALFSFEGAIKLIAISLLIVIPIKNRHLDNRFDEQGNPRPPMNSQ